jgi:hypothetical protein
MQYEPHPSLPSLPQVTVLSASYDLPARVNDGKTYLILQVKYEMTVKFSGTCVYVWQHATVFWQWHADVPWWAGGVDEDAQANIVDVQYWDTHTIGVDGSGKLNVIKAERSTQDNSKKLKAPYHPIVGQDPLQATLRLQESQEKITKLAEQLKSSELLAFGELPVSDLQDFIFPGRETFVFKDVRFSDNQDLVCHITYATPDIYNAL